MVNSASRMAPNNECKLKVLELISTASLSSVSRISGWSSTISGATRRAMTTSPLPCPLSECYAVYDFDFIADENCQMSKIFFIAWSPDTTKMSKMVYASSKDRFKRELDGIQVELQATDPSEMSIDIIKSRAL